jgi:hypothetical protein
MRLTSNDLAVSSAIEGRFGHGVADDQDQAAECREHTGDGQADFDIHRNEQPL